MDDQDADGLCGDATTAPFGQRGQANADGDRFGDACDLCPSVVSQQNRDGDGDGLGDVRSRCGRRRSAQRATNDDNDAIPDDDGDGVIRPVRGRGERELRRQLLDRNPLQPDHDNDGIGDACDTADGTWVAVRWDRRAPASTFIWEPEDDAIAYNVYSER
jgi:hypothetical protein